VGAVGDASSEPGDTGATTADAVVATDSSSGDGGRARLVGTALDGIAIRIDRPLDLCSTSAFGTSSAEGRARQVRVRIPPHSRPSLEAAQLESAHVTQGSVEADTYSPLVWILEAPSATTLAEWVLTGTSTAAAVSATLSHALGPAGVLEERLRVRRTVVDRRDVTYGDDDEVRFRLIQGGAPIDLITCGGPAQLEPQIVMATFVAGERIVTVLREQRAAGPSELYPIRGRLHISSAGNVESQDAQGYFAHTLVAAPGDGAEHSRIDFTRDRRWSSIAFEPLGRGERARFPGRIVETAELDGVGLPTGGATLREVDLDTGDRTTTRYAAVHGWRRLDAADLLHDVGLPCATPVVRAYMAQATHRLERFILAGCEGAGPLGFDARILVPVIHSADPPSAGMRFAGSPLGPAGEGIRFDLGEADLELRPHGGAVALRFVDAAGVEVAAGDAYLTSLIGALEGEQTVSWRSIDGAVQVDVEQHVNGAGGGLSTDYSAVSLALTFAGRTHRVLAWDKLRYTSSHHNFDDRLVAETPELRIFWVGEFGRHRGTVRAERVADGREVLPLTEIGP